MTTLSARVQAFVAEQIISGRLAPGERLDERALAEQFNASRTPVREAFRELAARGLIRIQPRRGVVVMEIGVDELAGLLRATSELEALCARLAAESMTPMEKSELDEVHRQSAEHVRNKDVDAYLAANRELHRLIVQGAHNPLLAAMVDDLRYRLSPYRQFHPDEASRLASSHAAHGAIVEAVLAGRAAQAHAAMRAHSAPLGNKAVGTLRRAGAARAPRARAA